MLLLAMYVCCFISNNTFCWTLYIPHYHQSIMSSIGYLLKKCISLFMSAYVTIIYITSQLPELLQSDAEVSALKSGIFYYYTPYCSQHSTQTLKAVLAYCIFISQLHISASYTDIKHCTLYKEAKFTRAECEDNYQF